MDCARRSTRAIVWWGSTACIPCTSTTLGEGELGEKGCANFVSEPRFERLPCVLETGRDGGAPANADVALAFKLRKRGKASRARSDRGARGRAPTKQRKR
jgi:hypothetical protein